MNSSIRVVGLDLDGTLYPSTAETQRRIREFNKIMKELYKEGKIKVPEEYDEKIKELLLLKD